jgi:hypothetical protein
MIFADSGGTQYQYMFPLYGQAIIEAGHDLPLPFGINVDIFWQKQDVEVQELDLGFGIHGLQDFDFMEFESVTSTAYFLDTRVDLWILPFVNVYYLVGFGKTENDVKVTAPFAFETSADFSGWTYGPGITFAFGIPPYWLHADWSWSWSELEDLEDPTFTNVLTARLGRDLSLGNHKAFRFWVGAMHQDISDETRGSLLLSEVITDELMAEFANYWETEWYNSLTARDRLKVDQLIQVLATSDPATTSLHYAVVQELATPWNMLIGAQFSLNKKWQVQGEFGFLGSRQSAVVNLNYRLPI